MNDLIVGIANTALPNILVLAGILFLFLAIVGKLGATIVVNSQKQNVAGLLGVLLLVGGIALYFMRPSTQDEKTISTFTTPDGKETTVVTTPQTNGTPQVSKETHPPELNIADRTRENWFFGNYNEALNGYSVIKEKHEDSAERRLAEKRFNWLEPYRGRILFADDFEDDTLDKGVWNTHPGYPEEEDTYFKRVHSDGNAVLEGYGHHHAVAKRIMEGVERGERPENFEVRLKFYPTEALKGGFHLNTTLSQRGRFTAGFYMEEKRIGLFEVVHERSTDKGHRQTFVARWYNLRISVQARHVQVFLDDQLTLDYESPSSQPLLTNFNLETLTGTIRFDDILVSRL